MVPQYPHFDGLAVTSQDQCAGEGGRKVSLVVLHLAILAPYHFMPGKSMRQLAIILTGIAAHKSISIVLET